MSTQEPLRVKSRHIHGRRYEVEGVIIQADSMSEAVRKWTRTPKRGLSANAVQ